MKLDTHVTKSFFRLTKQELQKRIIQLEAELRDRCATIDAIEDGKTIDYYVLALQETNKLLFEARERIAALEAGGENVAG